MTSQSTFAVSVDSTQLVIAELTNGEPRMLGVLDRRMKPSFYIENDVVVCRDHQGKEFTLETTAGRAHELLAQLVPAKLNKRFIRSNVAHWMLRVAIVGGLIITGYLAALSKDYIHDKAAADAGFTTSAKALSPGSNSRALVPVPGVQKDVEWKVPASVPIAMGKAAATKLFSVDYSSGHARTLYVFADPACPNCQRLEPLLKAASNTVNVVVFPVAVIGKEKSIASITPVLCLPPELRKAAWEGLFDIGRDGLTLGKAGAVNDTEIGPSACADGERALGINEVAYKAYRIPGTPWVIADDGRHVKQSLLGDPARLDAFLNGEDASNAAE